MDRYEMLLSGAGGQGLILAGIILAEGIVKYTDKNAIQTQSYGPEARGGASKAEVIVAEGPIHYPKVSKPDLLLALTQEAYNKYHRNLKEYGILIVDQRVHIAPRGGRTYAVPILKSAQEKAGRSIVANILSLGLIARLTGFLSAEMIEKAVLQRVPKGTEEVNKKALDIGFELADQLQDYEIRIKEEDEE